MRIKLILSILFYFIRFNDVLGAVSCFYSKNKDSFNDSVKFAKSDGLIDNGLKNGYYWFRFTPDVNDEVLEVESIHVANAELFSKGNSVKRFLPSRFFTFMIPSEESVEFTLKVEVKKEAKFSLNFYSKDEFQKNEEIEFLKIGFYYSIAFMVFILNIIYSTKLKDRVFYYYARFLIIISFCFLYIDGLIFFVFDAGWINNYYESIFHLLLVFGGATFATNYLGLDKYFPNIRKIRLVMLSVATIPYLIYIVLDNYTFYIVGESISILILFLFWLSGAFAFNQSLYARLFMIAYSVVLFMALDNVVLPSLGLPNVGVTADHMKIAGVFEMFILFYAVLYRARTIEEELDSMKEQIKFYITEISKLESSVNNATENLLKDLSHRELEVLELIKTNLTYREIAETLFVSQNTIKTHVRNIYKKLGVKSRTEVSKLSNI